MVCPLLDNHTVFTGLNAFSDLVLHDINLHIQYYIEKILVHGQLNPDQLRVMRNDEASDAFDSKVCHEWLSFGMAIITFTV